MYNLALNTKEPCVILIDRGLMDSLGYCKEEMFESILKKTGWNWSDLRDKRYDAVIHLITAADGVP